MYRLKRLVGEDVKAAWHLEDEAGEPPEIAELDGQSHTSPMPLASRGTPVACGGASAAGGSPTVNGNWRWKPSLTKSSGTPARQWLLKSGDPNARRCWLLETLAHSAGSARRCSHKLQTFIGSKKKKVWIWTGLNHHQPGILATTVGDRSGKISQNYGRG